MVHRDPHRTDSISILDAGLTALEYVKNYPANTGEIFFIPNTNSEPSIYFGCFHNGPINGDKLLNCRADTDLREDIRLEYIFNSADLPRWRVVDDKVRRLAFSFLQSQK